MRTRKFSSEIEVLTFRINQIYQITDLESLVNIVLKFECPLWNSNFELILPHLFCGVCAWQKTNKKVNQKSIWSLPKFRSKWEEIWGHSTTTWTEIFDPTLLCIQFYTLSVDKNRYFLTPSSPHLIHIVIEWPLSKKCLATSAIRTFSLQLPIYTVVHRLV